MSNRIKTQSSKKNSFYSKEFKQMVCEEFMKGKKTKETIRSEFGIRGGTSLLLTWLRQLGYVESDISTIPELPIMAEPKKETPKSLERENEDLKLQLEMYKRMIEIAEKEFKIPIVKKSDTK
jgi:transposase-like protein